MESDGRRAAESFGRLKNELIGLFLVVAGGRSLGGLVTDLIHGAAETGRFAQSIGLATDRVSVWEMAVQSMGGTAQDARTSLAALNAEYTNYMLTGRAVHDADLAALGIGANDLQSPEQLALALAERRSHMTQREFSARLQRLGLSDSFIRTLAQGRRGVEDLLGQMERIGPITDRDSRAAQEYERQLSILSNRIKADLRPALSWLLETGLPFLEQHSAAAAGAAVGLSGALALVALRFTGLPGLVAAFVAELVTMYTTIEQHGGFGGFLGALEYRYRGIRIAALTRERDAIPFTPGLNTPENRANGQRRLEIDRQISDLETARFQSLQGSGYVDPQHPWSGGADASTAAPVGGGNGSAGMALHFSGSGRDLARVRQTESGNNYNRVVYDLPSPRPPTSMTLGEIYDFQPSLTRASRGRRGPNDPGSSAIGAYQFVRGTLRTAAEGVFGAAWRNQRFSPGTQDRLAQWLHARRGVRDWAIGGGATLPGGARTNVRMAGGGGGSNVHVGSIVVYTPHGTSREQAEAVAREIPRAVQRRGVITQANGGLK